MTDDIALLQAWPCSASRLVPIAISERAATILTTLSRTNTAATFAAVAEKPLAQSLEQDPPRLPAGTEVPEARVMNVVLSEPDGKQIEASVSLLRLRAASELRLTLQAYPEGWQVVGVRG